MKIPDEFVGRVYKTRLSGLSSSFEKLDQIRKDWPGTDIDVIYENFNPIVVLVFETQEDHLAYKLKYGDYYA
jgi:hypothetical protein